MLAVRLQRAPMVLVLRASARPVTGIWVEAAFVCILLEILWVYVAENVRRGIMCGYQSDCLG